MHFPEGMALELGADGGGSAGGTLEMLGVSQLFFRPHTSLAMDTGYTATVFPGACDPLSWSFETGDAGVEVDESQIHEADYFLDHETGWTTDINGSYGSWGGFDKFVEMALHARQVDSESSQLELFSAVVDHDDGVVEQEMCIATSRWTDGALDTPAHWHNPDFSALGFGYDFFFDYEDGAIGRVHEADVAGTFRTDDERITGIVLDDWVDMSFLTRAHVHGTDDEDDPCGLVESLSQTCVECPDGQLGCVRQRTELLEALRVDVLSIHPETGEELTTLLEVSQEQVDEWTAAGFCP